MPKKFLLREVKDLPGRFLVDMEKEVLVDIAEKYGKPPPSPPGWNPCNDQGWGDTHGPGPLELNEHQKANPWFATVARLAWVSGQAHQIPWMWKVCEGYKFEQEKEQWEEVQSRGTVIKLPVEKSHAAHSVPKD